jgi:lycopene cyclase-like protein
MGTVYDVIVAGGGPCGLALAAALSRRGLAAAVVDPCLDKPWENNTCAWADEIIPLGYEAQCKRIWRRAEVIYNERSSQVLDRGYVVFDNTRLKDHLLASGYATISASAAQVSHTSSGSSLRLDDGRTLQATLVVDATGHSHRLVQINREPDSFQNVHGILARVDGHPFNPEHMILMDFRAGFMGADRTPPTFLYAMPYDKELIFLEESSLADNPGLPFKILQSRLQARLEALNIRVKEIISIEEGALPLNPSAPVLTQRVIGFGAAGGFVHPSTGWCVAHALRLADPVAAVIADGLGARQGPGMVAQKAWKLMWPPDLMRMRTLHLMGLDFFCRIGIKPLSLFMKLFFNAPGRMWQTYLSNDCTISRINRSLLQ